jgi:hypothetical protein
METTVAQKLHSTDTGRTSAPDVGIPLLDARDKRIANAIRLRRAAIRAEMEACLRGREEAHNRAEAHLDKFDELAETDNALRAALAEVELRLQQAGVYFLSQEQLSVMLDRIAEVGADTRRFCMYLGVDAVAKIPAHEFDASLAALELKRRGAA